MKFITIEIRNLNQIVIYIFSILKKLETIKDKEKQAVVEEKKIA